MRPKSILGEAAAEISRYDWGLMLATYTLGVVAFQLGAPLWAAVIGAFSGHAIVGVKHTRRNLGLIDSHDTDEREATPPRTVTSPPTDAPPGIAGPSARSALSSPPRAAGKP